MSKNLYKYPQQENIVSRSTVLLVLSKIIKTNFIIESLLSLLFIIIFIIIIYYLYYLFAMFCKSFRNFLNFLLNSLALCTLLLQEYVLKILLEITKKL